MALKGLFRSQPVAPALATSGLSELAPQSFSLVLYHESQEKGHVALFDSRLQSANDRKSGFAEFLFGAIPLALQSPVTKLHVIHESSQIMVSILFPLNFQRYLQEKYGDHRFSLPSSACNSAAPSPSASPSPAPLDRAGDFSGSLRGMHALQHLLRIRVNFSIGLLVSVFKETSFLGSFIYSHFDLIVHYLHALREKVERILVGMYVEKNSRQVSFTFLALQQNAAVREAVGELQKLLSRFIMAPRIRQPLWLEIGTFPHLRKEVLPRFLQEMKLLYHSNDSVLTNRFLSSVLSGVLAHHRSWLSSVGLQEQRDHKMHLLHQQIAELFGHPPLSLPSEVVHMKVVILGKKPELVTRLLFFLSYFIRCTELYGRHEHVESQCLPLQNLFKQIADGQGAPAAKPVPLPTTELGESGAGGESDLQWVSMPPLSSASCSPSSPTTAAAAVAARDTSQTSTARVASSPSHPPPAADSSSSTSSCLPFRTLAHSLFVACTPYYQPHAVVQGLVNARTSDVLLAIAHDLRTAVSQPLIPGTRAAVCLLANLDTGDCELIAHYPLHVSLGNRVPLVVNDTKIEDIAIERVFASDFVSSLLSEVVSFAELGVPPENVLQYLEDKLHELKVQAEVLCAAVGSGQTPVGSPLAPEHSRLAELSKALGFSKGDLSLLLAIAVGLSGAGFLDKGANVTSERKAT